jgi:hypothetical protein
MIVYIKKLSRFFETFNRYFRIFQKMVYMELELHLSMPPSARISNTADGVCLVSVHG